MLECSKLAEKHFCLDRLKIIKNENRKNIELKEIRSRGFQSKKNTKFGYKALEIIKFGDTIALINGKLILKEEFKISESNYYFLDEFVFCCNEKMFRKGCRPYAKVKLCKKDDEVFFGVFAIRKIAINDEIVIEYDKYNVEKKTCTCVNLDFCLNPDYKPEKED
ncbi:hypothetical protein GVAV_002633 [Gurleya vavrai]